MNPKTHTKTHTLDPELLQRMNAYWRAANYVLVGRSISTPIRCCVSH